MNTKDLLTLSESFLTTPKETEPKLQSPKSVVDDGLKDVEVPDDFRDQIMEFAGAINEACGAPHKKKKAKKVKSYEQTKAPTLKPKLTEAQLLEKRLQSLVKDLKSLLGEAAQVLKEMTMSGDLGTGTQKTLSCKKMEYPPKPRRPIKKGTEKRK